MGTLAAAVQVAFDLVTYSLISVFSELGTRVRVRVGEGIGDAQSFSFESKSLSWGKIQLGHALTCQRKGHTALQ